MQKGNPIPSLRIKLASTEIPKEAYADLLSVHVEQDIEAPAMFALRFATWDPKKVTFSWVDDPRFAPATAVSVEMGYIGKLAEVLRGEITGVEMELAAGEVPALTVRGYDKSHRLTRATKTRSFNGKTDTQIVEEIARENGIAVSAESTGVQHASVIQYNRTDLAFLRSRAALIHFEVVMEKDTLHFRKQQDTGAPAITLSSTGDVIELSARLTTRGLVDTVEVHAWDQKKKETIVGKATSSQQTPMGGAVGTGAARKAFGSATAVEPDLPVSTKQEADQTARAELDRRAAGYILGDAVCFGRTDIRAGMTAKLDGFGKRFSGPYDVLSTVHSFTPKQGYRTSFKLRRNAS